MMVLLCTLFLIIIYLIFDEKKYCKYGIVFSLILIFSLFAFRNIVGVDDNNYKLYFDLISAGYDKKFFDISGVEYSYYIICKILSFFKLNYKSIFFVYSSISFTFIFKTLKKFSLNKEQYLTLFLSFLAFSLIPFITVMRQFTATSIAIYAICDKKINIKNMALIIIATLFHNSAIIFLPILLISKIKFINKKVFYILIPLIAIFLNSTGIFYSLVKVLLKGTSYYRYILEMNETVFGGSGIIVMLMFLVYLANLLFLEKELNNENIKLISFMQMIFFSLYFLCYGMGVIGRLYYYFIFFEPLSLILICKNIKSNNNKLSYYLTSSFLVLLIFYNIMNDLDRFRILNYSINFWR
jgi:hypothetical protein